MSRDLNVAALRFTSAWVNFIRVHIALYEPNPTRQWMRSMLSESDDQASRLLESIFKEELDKTKINFIKLSRTDCEYLLQENDPKITKMDTNMRKSSSAKDKLIVKLRYLTTGDSCKTLEYSFRVSILFAINSGSHKEFISFIFYQISAQAIGAFIPVVCDCLVELVGDKVKVRNKKIFVII